jgi:hypothetical protein
MGDEDVAEAMRYGRRGKFAVEETEKTIVRVEKHRGFITK